MLGPHFIVIALQNNGPFAGIFVHTIAEVETLELHFPWFIF